MTIISPQDIDNFSVLEEFFNRAMASPENKNPIQTAERVIVNILSHAESLLKSGADNVGVAVSALEICLARCIEIAEASPLAQATAFAKEISETSISLTHSI